MNHQFYELIASARGAKVSPWFKNMEPRHRVTCWQVKHSSQIMTVPASFITLNIERIAAARAGEVL